MSPSLQAKLKNIESYLVQLRKHNEKLLWAIMQDDTNLVVYYKKETESFIFEIEKIFKNLNKHEQVEDLYSNFQEIRKKLDNNFREYEK